MRARTFTLAEANALIPEITPLVSDLANALHAYRTAEEQLADLRAIHGEGSPPDAHPDHKDFTRFTRVSHDEQKRATALVTRFADMGVEVKDPYIGLIDFPCERRTRAGEVETVYLCWRLGEPAITHWHPIEGGYAGRKTVAEL